MAHDELNSQFDEIVKEAFPENLVTNYLTVVEVISDDGEPTLSILMSDHMTPWLAGGMLQSAMDILFGSVHADFPDIDES